ncbi:MAG: caspase family protein, partial [Candidatus Poribacteria bacterium]
MKIAKSVLISLLLLMLFGVITSLAQTASEKKQTIYSLLVIADADPSIGRAVEVDRQRIEGMLKVASGICDVKIEQLLSSRGELKSEPVLQWLKNVNLDSNDTLLIYYSGHGGMNKNKETFLYLQDGYFFRSKLVNAIESAKKCRLKMLITDCCSDGPETEVPAGRPPISKKALQDLFLLHEGFLHITAASEGEYSWCSPRYGGWFTRAMVDSFDDSTDLNMDGFVGWDEVLKLTIEAVQKKFQQSSMYFSAEQKKDMANRGIKSQTPKSYSMPKRVDMSKIS